MKELFPVSSVRMLSPRLAWCRLHGVTTTLFRGRPSNLRWEATSTKLSKGIPKGLGETEEEACRDYGVKCGIRLWNEVAP